MARTALAVLVIFGFLFLAGPVLIIIALWQGKPDIFYKVGRLDFRAAFRVAGVQVETDGLEHIDATKSYLFLANHQGNCDPPALIMMIPQCIKFILKKELSRIPVLNVAMRLSGFIFIDRKDRANSVHGIDQAVSQLKRGDSFLVFPEGTRTRTGKMGGFKKGPFVMAIQSGVPIVPVTISGSYRVMPATRFRISPGVISLKFHPPIETQELSPDRREWLRDEVWRIIASGLKHTEEAPA